MVHRMNYWILVEENETGYEAFCPDLEDVRAGGDCVDGAAREVMDILERHFDGLCTDGTLPADLAFQQMRVSLSIL